MTWGRVTLLTVTAGMVGFVLLALAGGALGVSAWIAGPVGFAVAAGLVGLTARKGFGGPEFERLPSRVRHTLSRIAGGAGQGRPQA